MAGGTIFEKPHSKSITLNGDVISTGDNCLIIDPKYIYQVPFSFGGDWNILDIGVFISYVKSDDNEKGFNNNTLIDSGGTSNDTFTWIGLTKNAQTKTLPLDAANQGFVGYKANAISLTKFTSFSYNRLFHADLPNAPSAGQESSALAVSSFGTEVLSTGEITRDGSMLSLSSSDVSGQVGGGAIVIQGVTSGFAGHSNSKEGTDSTGFYATYFGMRFQVHNKGTSNQRIEMAMAYPQRVNSSNIILKCGVTTTHATGLKEYLDGKQVIVRNQHQMTGMLYTGLNGQALDIPDSFMFYNAFTNARPRIHAWGAKKIS